MDILHINATMLLYVYCTNPGQYICGATLIDELHVITAGHCVAMATGDSSEDAIHTTMLSHYFSIVLGSTSTTSGPLEQHAVQADVEHITVSITSFPIEMSTC